jgi:hypothetical protein
MEVIYAPTKYDYDFNKKYVFIAGSIEMGTAEDWQSEVIKQFEHTNFVILNPRRLDWDSSWEQTKDNPKFREQVMWELASLERADHILLYFSPGTKSPISLLELGLFQLSRKLIVVCPEGFWRKGNVDLVCERYSIVQEETLNEAVNLIKRKVRINAIV